MNLYDFNESNSQKTTTMTKTNFNEKRASRLFGTIERAYEAKSLDLPDYLQGAVQLSDTEKSFKEVEAKAMSTTAGNGIGFISTISQAPVYLDIKGGTFLASGIQFKDDVRGNAIFNGITNIGKFKLTPATGTNITNDITNNSVLSKTISAFPYSAMIENTNRLLSNAANAGELLATFEMALQEKKLVLSDDVMVDTIFDPASGVAPFDLTPIATTPGKISLALAQMIAPVSRLGAPVITTSVFGFTSLMNERNTQGDYIQKNGGFIVEPVKDWYGAMSTSKPVGYFSGFPIYIAQTIDTQYDVNTTGVIGSVKITTPGNPSAQVDTVYAAGTKTPFFVYVPRAVGFMAGAKEFDIIRDFSDDRVSFLTDNLLLGARTQAAGVVIVPKACTYVLV